MRELFQVLASMYTEPLLTMMAEKPMCRQDMELEFKITQSQISRMFKVYRRHGLIEEVKENGTWKRGRRGHKFYRATDKYQRIKQAI